MLKMYGKTNLEGKKIIELYLNNEKISEFPIAILKIWNSPEKLKKILGD